MTFDPMKFYEDGKRRESRWGAVTPFILVGLLLLVMGVAGYFGYKGARPKHTLGSPAVIPYTKLAGVYCPEGVCPVIDTETDGNDPLVDAKDRLESHVPRKHKRRVDGHLVWYDIKFTPSPNQPYESWRLVNTIPSEWSCTRQTKASGMHCDSRPLTPAEIEQYKPMAETAKPVIDFEAQPRWNWGYEFKTTPVHPVFGLDDGDHHAIGTTESNPDCSDPAGEGFCPRRMKNGMPLCAPDYTFASFECPSYDPDAKEWISQKEASVRVWRKEHPGIQPVIQNNELLAKPSCVMPADIDVCPVQMLEPKAATDSSSSLTVAAALMTCAIQPDAAPVINLKSGPTPVPCATLKWATDAVDADKKKASHD